MALIAVVLVLCSITAQSAFARAQRSDENHAGERGSVLANHAGERGSAPALGASSGSTAPDIRILAGGVVMLLLGSALKAQVRDRRRSALVRELSGPQRPAPRREPDGPEVRPRVARPIPD